MAVTFAARHCRQTLLYRFCGRPSLVSIMTKTEKPLKGRPRWRKLLAAAFFLGIFGILSLRSYGSVKVIEDVQLNSNASSPIMTRGAINEEGQPHRNVFQSFQGVKSPLDYCAITQCESITCSSIPMQFDPGEVASSFINITYKGQCRGIDSLGLIFRECKFPSNELRENWLSTNLSIKELFFYSCSLISVHGNAFAGKIYEATEVLSFTENKISSLQRSIFHNLPSLQRLIIQSNPLKYAELNLLEDVASTLQVLHLEGAIRNVAVLRNVTGGRSLPAVQLLSIRGNSIPTIDRSILAGVPRVRSLYVDRSEVIDVENDAFQPISRSVEQLFMSDNSIASLPNGLFELILRFNKQFRLTVTQNPWHCDCRLKWMQELIENYPYTVTTVPICQSPEDNASLPFTKAKFCNDTIELPTGSTATEKSTNADQDRSPSTVTSPATITKPTEVTCQNANSFLLQRSSSDELSADYRLAPRFPNFSVAELGDGTVGVSLPELDASVTILWFSNSHSKEIDSVIRCVKNVKRPICLTEVEADTDYTVCLLDDKGVYVSPLNCLAVSTSPTYLAKAWITNRSKAAIIAILVLSIVLLCAGSALIMFLIVRRNPTLLRGSKRVLMVKRRSMDAIVLPEGFFMRNREEQRVRGIDPPFAATNCKEDGYVTPLPRKRSPTRKDSRTSGVSLLSTGTSYVSGIEPTLFQLASWRLKRLKSEIKSHINSPPVPPHRRDDVIPSLSMSVDSNIENATVDVVSMTADPQST